jgi:hypothetical protein
LVASRAAPGIVRPTDRGPQWAVHRDHHAQYSIPVDLKEATTGAINAIAEEDRTAAPSTRSTAQARCAGEN